MKHLNLRKLILCSIYYAIIGFTGDVTICFLLLSNRIDVERAVHVISAWMAACFVIFFVIVRRNKDKLVLGRTDDHA